MAAAIVGLPTRDPRARKGLPDDGHGACDICGEEGCGEACLMDTGAPGRMLRFLTETLPQSPDILHTALTRCRTCGRLRGHVLERYNGKVPVRCPCPRRWPAIGGRGFLFGFIHGRTRCPGPLMVSLPGDRATWSPESDYVAEDGKVWHMPWFVGYALSQPGFGFPLLSD